jgi:phytoene desaturase
MTRPLDHGRTTTTPARGPGPAPHAVVIGAGFGGLAAAIRLGARGYRVTVLDRLDAPGGRAYVHRIGGYTFDAGPTIVTAPFLFEELWTLCGKRMEEHVELRPMDPFYRIRFDDGSIFDTNGDAEFMRREVGRLSPDDVEGYERLLEASGDRYGFGFEELGNMPFSSFAAMAKALPKLAMFRSDRSVHKMVSGYLKDPRLRIALGFHPLFIGGNPLTITSMYTLISSLERKWGVHFAMGGTGALVQGLADLVEGQGSTIRCGETVSEILVENGVAKGVRLETGEVIRAHLVVSNADVAHTYGKMVAPGLRKRWTDRKIEKTAWSMGVFVWYFGTNRRWDDVQHHTIVLGPRYEGLLQDIFTNHYLPSDFSLYLHRPTATDPSLAPPGCDAFYALSPVPNLLSGTDWAATAESYRAAIEERLEQTVLPGLKGSVTVSHVTHPLDFKDRLLAHQGAAFGPEPLLLQSAWWRTHNKSEEVKNLFFVGAGTHPGAGLPGVLASARILEKEMPHAEVFR